jgi:hypothetical protein
MRNKTTPNIKTDISVKKPIFDELKAINAACADEPDANEKAVQKRMRRKQRKIVQGQW